MPEEFHFNPLDYPVCFDRPDRILNSSAWNEHTPFGMFLVDFLRPKMLVELGTHTGVSYCAFCQAVKKLGTGTKCYAIDTWVGDQQAGFYGPEVLAELTTYHDPLYGGFSRLLQMSFDEAVKHFSDRSIDLLHIDGRHSYKKVKHDFETWLPKLSDCGVVLFHDINERKEGFGVWRFWEEIKGQYPGLEFSHGHGLGVLFVGTAPVPSLIELFSMPEDHLATFKKFFFELGSEITSEIQTNDLMVLYRGLIQEKEQNLVILSTKNNDLEQVKQQLYTQTTGLEGVNQQITSQLAEKEEKNQRLNAELTQKGLSNQHISARMLAIEQVNQNLIDALAKKDQEILQFVTQINQKDALIKAFYAQVAEIYGSTGWLLVQFLWRIRDFLTPPGTFREKVVRKIGKFLFSGLRKNNILRKTKNFLQSKSQNNNNVSLPVDPIPNASIQNSMPLIIQEPQALQTIINSEVVIEQTPSPIQISSMDIDTIISERFWFSNPLRGFSIPHPERRLNLVTDSINSGSLFGGVATSIIFSAIMAGRWNCELRVITRTEIAHKQNFQRILETNGISFSRNVEFLYAPSANRHSEIPVGEGDVFLTTSWWTTQSIKDTFGEKKILYLLQEDERAFYPFGDERLRCENILKSPNIKFIINSKLLFDHLVSEGFENIRENGLWFEPSFSNALFHIEEKDLEQKSNFFFYARPNNIRNLFYLGLEVIEKAVTKGILNPDEWNFHFVGKNIPEIRIDSTHLPFIFQNLSLLDYASLARKVDLGFCLMYTPHPSYPPLDLAACGAVVITNRFGLKQNLDQYSKNIFCCELDSDSLVQGIEQGIQLSKSQQRYKNFADNQILRDWYTSFKDVLIPLDKWSSNVSY